MKTEMQVDMFRKPLRKTTDNGHVRCLVGVYTCVCMSTNTHVPPLNDLSVYMDVCIEIGWMG